MLLQDVRRRRDVGEHRAEGGDEGDREADVRAVGEQRPRAGEHRGETGVLATLGGQGLGDGEDDAGEDHRVDGDEHPEDAAPADGLDQQASDDRAEHRRDAAEQHEDGEDPRNLRAAHEVDDRGARQDDCRAAGEALDQAGDVERPDSGGERRRGGGEEQSRGAGDEQAAAPARIRHRARDELPDGHAGEEEGDGQLGRGLVDVELVAQLRQSGQVHVDRHRFRGRHQGQHAEQQRRDEAADGRCSGRGLRLGGGHDRTSVDMGRPRPKARPI